MYSDSGRLHLDHAENGLVSLMFLYITVLVGMDVYADIVSGATYSHILAEVSVVGCSLIGWLIVFARIFFRLNVQLKLYEGDLERVHREAKLWKVEAQHLIQGLSEVIDQQFDRWHFTASEREVAQLMLKGLSLKDVAKVRDVSERTVRQQTLSVYRKSGLAGRAELSAFFLEDLFLPATDR